MISHAFFGDSDWWDSTHLASAKPVYLNDSSAVLGVLLSCLTISGCAGLVSFGEGQRTTMAGKFTPAPEGDGSDSISVFSTSSTSPATMTLATVATATAPSITTQPATHSAITGKTTAFSVVAAGFPPHSDK